MIKVAVKHTKDHAPTGKGAKTRPDIVLMKMDRRVHAWGETLSGLGIANRIIRPVVIDITNGIGLTPSQWKFGNRVLNREAVRVGRIGVLREFVFGSLLLSTEECSWHIVSILGLRKRNNDLGD